MTLIINELIVQSYKSRIVAEKIQIVLLDPGLSAHDQSVHLCKIVYLQITRHY